MAAVIRPKESKGSLEPMLNTFAVENGVLWDYYSTKLGVRQGDFVEVIKLPPIISEGYITYKGNLYKITLRDFFRRRVNVGQPAYQSSASDSSSATTGTDGADPLARNVGSTAASANQLPAGDTFGIQVAKAADLAQQEQIRALLHSIDPEEEWIFESITQS